MNMSSKTLLLAAATLFGSLGVASPAGACGGFFCSQSQPVNQAAERIIFADNGDGTVTAVIQILYEGPSENFSWLLPISTAPKEGEIGVSSNLAFQRLQTRTNPQYLLTTMTEGTCREENLDRNGGLGTGGASATPPSTNGGSGGTGGGGVVVEASGSVGPFDWTVISVAEGAAEPASLAVEWLQDNDYDVPDSAPGLIGPYLDDGLFLLALRLTKGSDTGSIRPIMLTYDADKAMIPVKLTAVAANEDMGVMTWLLGDSRAVPENYLSLELNEARINWFNAALNYEDVVIEAANDAGGQGFVTEFSGSTAGLTGAVWQPFEQFDWDQFRTGVYGSFDEMFEASFSRWGNYDGYWDAVRTAVTLSEDVAFEDFQRCPSCYSGQVTYSPAGFVTALDENVIEPLRVVQDLINAHPQITRLYSTLSAEEMTLDPLFTFNPDLPDVSNVHQATRIIECRPHLYRSQAPWRVELPQGSVVRGSAEQAASGTWPDELAELPPNIRILRQSSSGDGRVLEDRSDEINTALDDYNATVPSPRGPGLSGGGCAIPSGASTGGLWASALLGVAAFLARRRTRRARESTCSSKRHRTH
jgi:hypothetical protein